MKSGIVNSLECKFTRAINKPPIKCKVMNVNIDNIPNEITKHDIGNFRDVFVDNGNAFMGTLRRDVSFKIPVGGKMICGTFGHQNYKFRKLTCEMIGTSKKIIDKPMKRMKITWVD